MAATRFGGTALVAGILVVFSVAHCGGDGTSGGGGDGGGDATTGGVATTGGGDGGGDAHTSDSGVLIEPGDPGVVDIMFDVHANTNVHAISPYIYGLNDGSQAAATHAGIIVSGGIRLTAFNWENNASNEGSDYLFQNDNYLCPGAGCDLPGTMLKQFVDSALATGAAALLTVPIGDYVAADKLAGSDVRSSANYLSTRFKRTSRRRDRRSRTRRIRPTYSSTKTKWSTG